MRAIILYLAGIITGVAILGGVMTAKPKPKFGNNFCLGENAGADLTTEENVMIIGDDIRSVDEQYLKDNADKILCRVDNIIIGKHFTIAIRKDGKEVEKIVFYAVDLEDIKAGHDAIYFGSKRED